MLASNNAAKVRKLAEVAWPSSAEESHEDRVHAATEAFHGLSDVPQEEQADVVISLLTGSQLAIAPAILGVMTLIAAFFSIPYLMGTAVAWKLLNRKGRRWVIFLRYQLIWWMSPIGLLFFVNALFAIAGRPFVGPPSGRFGVGVSACVFVPIALICYVAFRQRNAAGPDRP